MISDSLLGCRRLRILSSLSNAELKALVVELMDQVADLSRTVIAQREEIARLKGLKGRPTSSPASRAGWRRRAVRRRHRSRRGAVAARRRAGRRRGAGHQGAVPPGSRFKGYEDFLVQDLVLRPHVVRYRRERWLTPDGRTVVAPLPGGVDGHFGPELRRFVLAQYHQGQVTVPGWWRSCGRSASRSPSGRSCAC